jgi:ribose transport system ATP-binding protein
MIGATSFEVGEGEIVGIAGLMGSGREELASLCGGSLTATGGSVEIAGQEIRSMTPRKALASGIAYVAADRKNLSAIPSMTARENITLPRIRASRISSWLHLGSERRDAGEWMRRTNVQPLRTERAVATFSGGNQQKIVLARALRLQPKLLVIDQPVQGVDVGNKALIFKLLVDRSAEGMGIIAASSDPEDLAAICHRVLIIRQGRVVRVLSGDEVTAARITSQISLGEQSISNHTTGLTDSLAD